MTEETVWEKRRKESIQNCERTFQDFIDNTDFETHTRIYQEFKEIYRYSVTEGEIVEPATIREEIVNQKNGWSVAKDWVYYLHKLQVDRKSPDCKFLSYYPSYKYYGNDRLVSTTPGKYLLKFYAYLWESEKEYTDFVRKYLESVANPNNVFFAKTVGEIQKVYDTGPRSCMGNGGESAELKRLRTRNKIHPVAAYASGDLAVAYLKHPTNKNKITARTVVWPEKKIYSSKAYGDTSRLIGGLRELGYKAGPFYGAKVKKIKTKTGVLLPYMDNGSYLRNLDDKYFEIVNQSAKSDVVAQNAGGFVKTYTCGLCKGFTGGNVSSVIFNTKRAKKVCKKCIEPLQLVTCGHCGGLAEKEHAKKVYYCSYIIRGLENPYQGVIGTKKFKYLQASYACKPCFEKYFKNKTCGVCGDTYSKSHLVEKKYNGKQICAFCFKSDRTKVLSQCGKKVIDKKKVGVKCSCFTCALVTESL